MYIKKARLLMPSLNFKKQFVSLIESGKKRQTIRPLRKNPIKPGDKLFLFTGLRTKNCRKLIPLCSRVERKGSDWRGGIHVICKSIKEIRILRLEGVYNHSIIGIGRDWLTSPGINRLLQKDGFNSLSEFIAFFEKQYGLPFKGIIIKW